MDPNEEENPELEEVARQEDEEDNLDHDDEHVRERYQEHVAALHAIADAEEHFLNVSFRFEDF